MVAVVAALVVVGVGASSASAAGSGGTGSTDIAKCGAAYSSTEALCAAILSLARASQSTDLTPRDLQVAAPSSVIAATGSESPTRRVKEVQQWRPNTQAWVDAKTRLAGTTGLTTADIASTARWQPKLLKAARVAGGAASLIVGDTLLTWIVRDGVMYPALENLAGIENPRGYVEDAYCVRHGNVVTDWLGGWVGANCAEWRLDEEYQSLLAEEFGLTLEPYGGALVSGTERVKVSGYNSAVRVCGSAPTAGGPHLRVTVTSTTGVTRSITMQVVQQGSHPSWQCSPMIAYFDFPRGVDNSILSMDWLDQNGQVAASAGEVSPTSAEWISRVRCMDGTVRTAVSESFQQQRLGAVVAPASVQLGNCQPVGVDVGMQKGGTGTSGAGGGWSSVPGGDRTQVGTGEVPQPVRDWMQTYPQCGDGTCLLELVKDVGGHELSCFDVPDECVEWRSETGSGTSTYRCYYAQQVVDLSECNVYARVFDRTNVQQGTGYADPETGETVKTGTGTTATSNPGAALIAMSDPVADPASGRVCWPSGWGVLNPFEWVYMPVKCALEWAFVPRAEKVTQVQTQLQLKVTNSQVGRAAQVAATWAAVADATNPSGCAGPTISLNLMGIEYSGNPLSACAEPAATLAFWSRIIIGITAVLAALFAVTRYIGRVFGFEGFGRSAGGDS